MTTTIRFRRGLRRGEFQPSVAQLRWFKKMLERWGYLLDGSAYSGPTVTQAEWDRIFGTPKPAK